MRGVRDGASRRARHYGPGARGDQIPRRATRTVPSGEGFAYLPPSGHGPTVRRAVPSAT